MFIQTEQTPNPATLKFLPGRDVLSDGTAEFTDVKQASTSPLAARLFAVEGVTGVFFGRDFITVTRAQGKEWIALKAAILSAIMEHFQSGDDIIDADAAADHVMPSVMNDGEDNAVVAKIKELLDTRVRRLLRWMAATFSLVPMKMGWFICTCAGLVRAAPVPPPRSRRESKICYAITSLRLRKCVLLFKAVISGRLLLRWWGYEKRFPC